MFLTTSVHFLFLVFLGMLSLVLLLIIAVLIYSFYQYRESLQAFRWSEVINKKISEVIVYSEEEIPANSNFSAASGNASFRNLFLQRLAESEKKFSGAAQNKLKDLFQEYSLQEEALKKLNQKKEHIIAGGIQELTAMQVEEALPKISTFLTHPSAQVYQEAQYAMVNFKGFEGLHFLNSISSKISEWQQLRLLISITNIPENSGESIKIWMESSNDSVVIFTLKLLRKFQVLSLYSTVTDVLDHPSVDVRVQAVQTLLSLENSFTIGDLMEVYPQQPIEVQKEILKVMKKSKDQCCTDFLKDQLLNTPDSGIKVYAAEALCALEKQEYLTELSQKENYSEELIQIIKYALQEKVC
ncbi:MULTISPECIES: HEAT repeat domain-containing protein [unclassified Chryseobacterium]|uniref:HEAT repeat domain-containing protein n=1 Tax=unclassified Chryseobacterium TaxID=2593645 RepID=UPI00285361AA|nr:HEAT repeat domain-containing protein [Chryseobacterium sp. CFS7]MDR4891907.1 HEAT repeat domain-containing protein [Chryseobacterium sp. CFS7]